MLRYAILAGCLFAAVTFLTRSRRGAQALRIMAGLMIAYVVLKLTGAIEWLKPDRSGF